jgi:hypothetical protein
VFINVWPSAVVAVEPDGWVAFDPLFDPQAASSMLKVINKTMVIKKVLVLIILLILLMFFRYILVHAPQ